MAQVVTEDSRCHEQQYVCVGLLNTGSGRTRTGRGKKRHSHSALHSTAYFKEFIPSPGKAGLVMPHFTNVPQTLRPQFYNTSSMREKNTAALQCWEEMKLEGKLIISLQMKSDESECSSIVIQTGLLWANTVLSYGMHNKHLYPLGECSHQCSCAVLW